LATLENQGCYILLTNNCTEFLKLPIFSLLARKKILTEIKTLTPCNILETKDGLGLAASAVARGQFSNDGQGRNFEPRRNMPTYIGANSRKALTFSVGSKIRAGRGSSFN
jgi:hypothetical protein